ncbi:MAG: hypothetical protein U0T36_04180 [Saprospiraceae bacterium]
MFGTTLQTTTTVLSDVTASGMLSIPVTQGQIFSLVNYTEDATSGPRTATITNFRFQAAVVPAPWVINHVSDLRLEMLWHPHIPCVMSC